MGMWNDTVQNNIGGWFLSWDSDEDWMGKYRKEDKLYLQEKSRIPYIQRSLDELKELIEELEVMAKVFVD